MEKNQTLLRFLKQFFIQKPELHHPSSDYLLPTGAFYKLLDKERFRADRLGNPFSLVAISLTEELRIPKNLQELTSEIHAQTRLIDELGWFAPGVLGLYLFNTPEAGAKVVLERIRDNLRSSAWLENVEIMVYPDREDRSLTGRVAQGNKRIQERFSLQLVATMQPLGGTALAGIQTVTRDISATGAFVLTSEVFSEGTELELEIVLPIDELRPLESSIHEISVKAVGHVVRSEQHGVAIQFDEPHHHLAPLAMREPV